MKTTILLVSAICFTGCSTSTQTKREELTTHRQLDTLISVPIIRESGRSQNYEVWRKWLIPLLEFAPDTETTANFTTEDSSTNVSLNLRTGKTEIRVKPKPLEVKINERETRVKEDIKEETESIFEKPLLYVMLILLILVAGFIAFKALK